MSPFLSNPFCSSEGDTRSTRKLKSKTLRTSGLGNISKHSRVHIYIYSASTLRLDAFNYIKTTKKHPSKGAGKNLNLCLPVYVGAKSNTSDPDKRSHELCGSVFTLQTLSRIHSPPRTAQVTSCHVITVASKTITHPQVFKNHHLKSSRLTTFHRCYMSFATYPELLRSSESSYVQRRPRRAASINWCPRHLGHKAYIQKG